MPEIEKYHEIKSMLNLNTHRNEKGTVFYRDDNSVINSNRRL